jgi:hypothetical protein
VSDSVHPSLEELSGLRADALDDERGQEVRAHLVSCDECTRATAALAETESVLAAAATSPLPMPDGVSASLHDALRRASAERAQGVSSLSERRAGSPRRRPSATAIPRWVSAAGAAAAVALLGYAGVSLLHDSAGSSSSSSSSDAVSGARANQASPRHTSAGVPQRSGMSTPGKSGGTAMLTPRSLPGYATRLGAGPESAGAGASCRAVGSLPPGARVATVQWKGARALLVVDPARHRAKVYSCRDATVLFSTSY